MNDLPVDSSREPSAEPPAAGHATAPALQGLVVDWGGVLTGSLDGAMTDWASRDGVDFTVFREVMRQWVGRRGAEDLAGDDAAARPPHSTAPSGAALAEGQDEKAPVAELEQAPDAGPAGLSPVHRLERGEIGEAEFEHELAAQLAVRGAFVQPEGLLRRLLAGLTELDPRMLDLLRKAKAAGLRTALLSNSWGDHYPEQLWQGLFDTVVISGRVGMRKPEPEIFRYTARQLDLPPDSCVMVDDLPHNITGAVAVGMVGVLHRSYDETVGELEALFDICLR